MNSIDKFIKKPKKNVQKIKHKKKEYEINNKEIKTAKQFLKNKCLEKINLYPSNKIIKKPINEIKPYKTKIKKIQKIKKKERKKVIKNKIWENENINGEYKIEPKFCRYDGFLDELEFNENDFENYLNEIENKYFKVIKRKKLKVCDFYFKEETFSISLSKKYPLLNSRFFIRNSYFVFENEMVSVFDSKSLIKIYEGFVESDFMRILDKKNILFFNFINFCDDFKKFLCESIIDEMVMNSKEIKENINRNKDVKISINRKGAVDEQEINMHKNNNKINNENKRNKYIKVPLKDNKINNEDNRINNKYIKVTLNEEIKEYCKTNGYISFITNKTISIIQNDKIEYFKILKNEIFLRIIEYKNKVYFTNTNKLMIYDLKNSSIIYKKNINYLLNIDFYYDAIVLSDNTGKLYFIRKDNIINEEDIINKEDNRINEEDIINKDDNRINKDDNIINKEDNRINKDDNIINKEDNRINNKYYIKSVKGKDIVIHMSVHKLQKLICLVYSDEFIICKFDKDYNLKILKRFNGKYKYPVFHNSLPWLYIMNNLGVIELYT